MGKLILIKTSTLNTIIIIHHPLTCLVSCYVLSLSCLMHRVSVRQDTRHVRTSRSRSITITRHVCRVPPGYLYKYKYHVFTTKLKLRYSYSYSNVLLHIILHKLRLMLLLLLLCSELCYAYFTIIDHFSCYR